MSENEKKELEEEWSESAEDSLSGENTDANQISRVNFIMPGMPSGAEDADATAGNANAITGNADATTENADAAAENADAAAENAGTVSDPACSQRTPDPISYFDNPKKRSRKNPKINRGPLRALLCGVIFGVVAGVIIIGSFAVGKNAVQTQVAISTTTSGLSSSSNGTVTEPTSADEEKISSSNGTYTVSEISALCKSSVVAITNVGVTETQTLFGVIEEESVGAGSGVIIGTNDSELLIVTNYHVIEGSQTLSVCCNDSEDQVYEAQVKGTDSDNDLAVISVNLSDMGEDVLKSISIATIGSSDDLEVGDEVVAIGNALGYGQSVTSGIVSALDREVTVEDTTTTLLQTDAAINPGNSGGALFNMSGELVGINSVKYASEEVEGMGFAIPISEVKDIIETLMSREPRTKLTDNYGLLNISGQSVSDEASQLYGIPEGCYVYSVTDGGAADKAGIQSGDIITAIEGYSVSGIEDLQEELQYYKAGTTVTLTIARQENGGYEETDMSVTLDNASESAGSTDSSAGGNTDGGYWEGNDSTEAIPYGNSGGGSGNGGSYSFPGFEN